MDLSMDRVLDVLVRFGIALALALPVAWERERDARSLGLRTFPLVAVTSCAFLMFGGTVLEGNKEAQARVMQGLMTGIGFIGGGAILKVGEHVHGLATAASIWSTGAIGASVAYERYEIAVTLSIVNFVVLRVLTPLKASVDRKE